MTQPGDAQPSPVLGVVDHWAALRVPTAAQQSLIAEHIREHGQAPVFEIIVLDLEDDFAALGATLASLAAAREHYPALQWQPCSSIEQINPLIVESDARWIMLATAGELFTPGGLLVVGLELLADPPVRAVFGDELLRQSSGSLLTGLRPDFNLDYLLAFPQAMERHWLFRRETLIEVGGINSAFFPALEFELILRLINVGGMAGLGHVHEALVITPAPERANSAPHFEAIEQHLRLRGYENPVVNASAPGLYNVDYGHTWQPLVSIVLVMRDELAMVERCVMSLLEQTSYAHYEVILVDNASSARESRNWLQGMEKIAPERIRVLRLATALGHAAACNVGVEQARGEYVVLLRAQAAIVQGEWLAALLNHALRQEVAIVGAKTVSADGMVTHAGYVLGLNGVASSAFTGRKLDAPGYLNRLQVDQNYSAVSDVCMMVRKAVFDEIGGFDAAVFPGQGADIDLCLRIGALGYLTVWTPRALLMHNTLPPALEGQAEASAYERWLPVLARDPAYNLNFTLHQAGGFDLADARITWRPLGWRPLPVVWVHPADGFGSGNYRMIQPLNALKARGWVDGTLCSALLHAADLQRYTPDTIVIQRPILEPLVERLAEMKTFSNAFKIYELDDYLPNLPVKSVHRASFPQDILRMVRRGLACVDRFIVSTEPLAEAFSGLHPDIRVVPNRLDPGWWGHLPASQRRAGAKPRVGWAGGVGHEGDMALILDVVKALADEVEWVFLGGAPESFRPYAASFHKGVEIGQYPEALAAMNLDLALAPLEQNLFNECKSNLRLLEFGICGYPVVCSDVAPYRCGLPVTRVKNRYKDWVEAIRAHLADLDATARMGDALQAAVRRDWMLDDGGLQLWRAAWLPG